jgi:hypothetical protein
MPDFIITATTGDSTDPEIFEANVISAKTRNFDTIALAAIQRPTFEQQTDPKDTWEYFTFINAALFNIFETDLISGYLKPDTYKLNQDALKWKSDILAKHGMHGSLTFREPQWMPTPWYDDKPELKGCRCEHPSVARSPHWALNIDNERVLKHYGDMCRQLAELAPAIDHIFIQTNDSGAGINWCDGLYPGPNGPADTEDRDMGERIEGWFESMREGSKEADVSLRIDFLPGHFTPREIESVAKAFTASNLILGSTDPVTVPFINPKVAVVTEACKGTQTKVTYSANISNSYAWSGMIAPPQLYLAGEMMIEMKTAGIKHLAASYTSETPLSDSGSPIQQLFDRCVEKCPDDLGELDEMVEQIAIEMVGKEHKNALISAWCDVDTAIRVNRIDYQHNYYFFYGIIGRRWLTRPFVPNPDSLTDEERNYWSEFLMMERDENLAFQTLMAEENRRMFKPNEYAPFYNGLEFAAAYFARAIRALDSKLPKMPPDTSEWNQMKDQRDRIEFFGCLFKTQLHATGIQWVLDSYVGRPDVDKVHATREKKRLYDMIDGEIANCERMIELLDNPLAPLLMTGDEEAYTLPRNVPELLGRKIKAMKAHRHEVEEIFPGVGDWKFDEVTYSKSGDMITADEAELDD